MHTPLKKITTLIENWAPLHTAASWDNNGLQIGSIDTDIARILITLEINDSVFNHLEKNHYDLVITHHPLIFKALTSIDLNTDTGQIIKRFIQKDIALYAAHTNLDAAADGVNDALIAKYDIDPTSGQPMVEGIGKYFKKPPSSELKFYTDKIPGKLTLASSITAKKTPEKISRVAFCGGSGRSLLKKCVERKIDLFITGELGYHDEEFCKLNGIHTLQLGHRESEVFGLDKIKEKIASAYPKLDIRVL